MIHDDDERIPWHSAIDEKMLLLILRRVHTRLDHELSTLGTCRRLILQEGIK